MEQECAAKLHQNSINFIEFAQEIANDFAHQHQLNMKIYPYLKIAANLTKPEKAIENFLRVSMKPAAKDRAKYPDLASMPVVDGRSRLPYWESVRTRNLDFFLENVVMLLPDINMDKVAEWETIIPDLQYFTNENITNEIHKLLKLFKEKFIVEEDLAVLWEYFDCFIEHSMAYIKHRRGREREYLKELDLEREVRLFKQKGR